MTAPRCDQLDEYLCGWLSPDEREGFEAHLADCAECQRECAIQERVDGLMSQCDDDIAPAGDLRSRVDCAIATARRRRVLGWAGALTAAAVVALALAAWKARSVPVAPHDDRAIAQQPAGGENRPLPAPPPAGPQAPEPGVQVSMVDPSSAIVMPAASHSPNVTLVFVYPTFPIIKEQDRK
jgi:anti-sigma factor RsiW